MKTINQKWRCPKLEIMVYLVQNFNKSSKLYIILQLQKCPGWCGFLDFIQRMIRVRQSALVRYMLLQKLRVPPVSLLTGKVGEALSDSGDK